MSTEIAVDGSRFLINGTPTYSGMEYGGKPVEGLLLNSRMVQALFDDACDATRDRWRYPDTRVWDPDRNTDEFCAALPSYREHGLLAVTVGLQGGGSVYTPEVYDHFENSAFAPDGAFRKPYFDRLLRIIKTADAVGMVVIVNYFYVKHVKRIVDDGLIREITEQTTDWLLRTGHRNILVDLANEAAAWWRRPLFEPARIHALIDVVKSTELDGRRLLVGASTGGGRQIPTGKWLATEDVSMPHGNGCTPVELTAKLRALKQQPEYRARPRPICVNEDSVFVDNLEAAVAEGCSWGFYCQGYGSGYKDRSDWTTHGRESDYDQLSGFQTVPVNWGINTPIKRTFFDKVREISGQ